MSQPSEAQSPADRGAVDRADHGLVHVAQGQHDVVEHLERAQRDRDRREPVDMRRGTGVRLVRPRAESVPGAGQDHDADIVVDADLFDRAAQRKHHVEGHRVHAIGTIQREQGDVGAGSVDEEE